MNLKMRYRRTLYQLEAAEHEFEIHITLERACQVALVHQRGATEAVPRGRERVRAIQADIEPVERTRTLQPLLEERLAQRQHQLWCSVEPGSTEDFARYLRFSGCRCTRCQFKHCSAYHANGDFSVKDVLEFLIGVRPEPEPAGPSQNQTSYTPTRPYSPVEPQPQPSSPKRDDGGHLEQDIAILPSMASQTRDTVGGYQSTHEVRLPYIRVHFGLPNVSCAAECPFPTRSYICKRERKGQGRACA